MHISQNLKSILESKNVKQKALSQYLGVATSTINNWLKLNRSIPAEYIIPICEFLDVTPYLLLTNKESSSKDKLSKDEQEMLLIYKGLSDINKAKVKERATVLAELEVPVANEPTNEIEPEEQETIFIEFSNLRVSAGAGEPLIDDSYPDFIEVKKGELTENANFAVKINGKSMMPHFKDGDVVLVRSQPYVNVGEIGIFIIDGNGYIKERGDDRLISINPRYNDIYFEEGQEIRCKGLVIGTLEEDDFV